MYDGLLGFLAINQFNSTSRRESAIIAVLISGRKDRKEENELESNLTK